MAELHDLRADEEDVPEEEEEKDGDEKPREESGGFVAIQQNLFKARTILLFGEISMKVAQAISAQLLALAVENDQPIRLYINSPGGHVDAGDTIHDMIRFVGPAVKVIGTGWVASAGAHIFLAARRENRFCLPNTRFMIHQPLGGAGGKAVDIAIEAKEILRMRDRLNRIIARETGQPLERVEKDTDRNYWMTAEEARDYGIVGQVIASLSALD